mgnify:CR=1 FL=1
MNCKSITNQIVEFLRNKAISAKVNGFVLGVSGGVDSATVAALCAKTGLPTLLISMPCESNPEHNCTAMNYMKLLRNKFDNIWFKEIDLTPVFNVFSLTLPNISDLAKANLKSRIRMTTLYAQANTNSLIVVGTGNKVEDFGVGFFTKYGDGGVDISPIGDLLKSEVRELAKFLEVPEHIYSAIPTDGLWDDGRTDEGQLGASYDELEWAMNLDYNNYYHNISDRQFEVMKIYNNWHNKSAHKMSMPPICIINKE